MTTWHEIEGKLKSTKLNEIFKSPAVSHEIFLEDLKILKPIFDDKYLQKRDGFIPPRGFLNEIVNPVELMRMAPNFLHKLATMITEISGIKGADKLLSMLPSEEGYYYQLIVTVAFKHFFEIAEIERSKETDTDIVLKDGVNVHVKTHFQSEKSSAQFRAAVHINSILRKNKESRLGVSELHGIVPVGLEESDWIQLLEPLPTSPEKRNIEFKTGDEVILTFDNFEDSITGHVKGLDPLRFFGRTLLDLGQKIKNNGEKNVLFCLLPWSVQNSVQMTTDFLTTHNLDAVVFASLANEIEGTLTLSRSDIFAPKGEAELRSVLEKLPKTFTF